MAQFFALRRLEGTLRAQDAQIAALTGPTGPVAEKFQTIISDTFALADEQSAAPLYSEAGRRGICERLVFVEKNDRDLFRWYDANYLPDSVRLRISPPRLARFESDARDVLCNERVFPYFRARYDFARWLYSRCQDVGCGDVRSAVVENMESLLRGSPNRVKMEAYQRLVRLNEVILAEYRYVDDVLALMVGGRAPTPGEFLARRVPRFLSTEEIVDLQARSAADLAEYRRDCCIAAHSLVDFAWARRPQGGWKNLVTGRVQASPPTSGVAALSPIVAPEGCRADPGAVRREFTRGCRGLPPTPALPTDEQVSQARVRQLT